MRRLINISFLMVIATGFVFSQEIGRFGLIYKFEPISQLSANVDDILPTTFTTDVSQGIGVHYQTSDALAVQTTVLFGRGTFNDGFEADNGAEWQTDATITTFGVEAIAPWYLHRNGEISIFVAPSVRYNTFSYEDEFDSQLYWNTEYEARYQETNVSLQFGGQAEFGSFAVFSSYGFGVNFIRVDVETAPSEPLQEPTTERKIDGAGFTTSQLSIGLIYFVN